jgi:hypothetical protein
MNCSFEYVVSGLTYIRIDRSAFWENPDTNNWCNEKFKLLNTIYKDQKFGVLFNAFVEREKIIPKLLKNHCSDSVSNIFGDSGGLQIMTRKDKTLTEELKIEVYRNQAKHATKGMCFDMIPVKLLSQSSGKMDSKSRMFDRNKFAGFASQTGKNLKKQIEIFLEEKSEAKPVLILHGNCYDTYSKWTDIILKEIPSSLHQHIGGIASGGGALGNGKLEDIKRAFYLSQIDFVKDFDNFHVLGVGNIYRLIPYLIFAQSGLFNNKNISYDSTSHSMGFTYGQYQIDGRLNNFPKHLDHVMWPKIYNSIVENMGEQVPLEKFYNIFSIPIKKYEEEYGEVFSQTKAIVSFCLSSIINFMGDLENILHDKQKLMKLLYNKDEYIAYHYLYELKTVADFDYWEKELGKYVDSKPISEYYDNSITDFFD